MGTGDDQAVWGHWEDKKSPGKLKMAIGSRTQEGDVQKMLLVKRFLTHSFRSYALSLLP